MSSLPLLLSTIHLPRSPHGRAEGQSSKIEQVRKGEAKREVDLDLAKTDEKEKGSLSPKQTPLWGWLQAVQYGGKRTMVATGWLFMLNNIWHFNHNTSCQESSSGVQ